ncbi:isoflavone reductase homolog IRL-like isoform X1 [Miscanthus floridulus]|uniref:isoflavone reductase homolog IRL-like isoform X1 n=1 Tax=Miscanthus floridulus TaxID=154761 RepID=UPI003459A82C
MEKSRILIIGGTGHIGKHIVTASVRLGHLTVVLTRDSSPSDPAKAQLIKSFADSGAALIKKGRPGAVVRAVSLSHQVMGSKQPLRRFAGEGFLRFSLPQTPLISEPPALGLPPLGDVSDHGSLVKAVKSADIVISAVGPHQVGEQTRIIAAIKEAGNVKVDNDHSVYVPTQQLPVPLDILLSIGHAVYIKGEHKFKIDPSSGVDAGELYPDVKYTTVDDYLNRLL